MDKLFYRKTMNCILAKSTSRFPNLFMPCTTKVHIKVSQPFYALYHQSPHQGFPTFLCPVPPSPHQGFPTFLCPVPPKSTSRFPNLFMPCTTKVHIKVSQPFYALYHQSPTFLCPVPLKSSPGFPNHFMCRTPKYFSHT